MKKASKAKEESNIEEAKTNAKELKKKQLDKNQVETTPDDNLTNQGIHVEANKLELGDDDIRTLPIPQIKHPVLPDGPHLIENNEFRNFLCTC